MIGKQVGRYRIDKEIGRGGMGVVYQGTQVTLDRIVAIKMLMSHLADGDASARFQREALTLAKLAHPNIIHIYDVEEFEGSQFIVMEHVGGGSLGDLLEKTPVLSPSRVVEVMAPVMGGLAAAHAKGIIHRDIKPDNILFSDSGRPKLTDFGIAHMRGSHSKTRTGVMLGTPYYMSPEQARGQKVTPASDMYAAGVVMYEALTGRVPFTGEDAVSVALMHVQAEAEPIESIQPDVPAALCEVVRRAMAKHPNDRFGSAAEMEEALLAGGWAPRSSGSGAAVQAPDDAASKTVAKTRVGSLGGLGDGMAKLGESTGGLLTATGELLRRPGWKGMPMAFWLGAVALGGVALVGGVQAMSGPGGAQVEFPANGANGADSSRTNPVMSGSGDGSRRPTRRLPAISQPRTPSAEEIASIAGARNPESGSDPNPTQTQRPAPTTTQPRPQSPTEQRPRRDPAPGPTQDNPGPPVVDEPTPTPEVDDRAWEATASREIRAVLERQANAFATENRSLYLRDIHPSLKAEAARLYDNAVAANTEWSLEFSDVDISFLGREQAVVTYSVEVFSVVRRTGQPSSAQSDEVWTMRQEGGRWWLIAWEN